MSGRWAADHAVGIVERVVIEGTLKLITPAHMGDGVGSENRMTLLCDAYSKRVEGKDVPLLPGASLAGALRNALRERNLGYSTAEDEDNEQHKAIAQLFGGVKGDDDGDHTRLIVDDALGEGVSITRDGVKIDPRSRTASDSALYRIDAWDAGATFNLRFELLIRKGDDSVALKTAMATVLDCLANGEIALGARKRRGYGQVTVGQWHVQSYRVNTLDGLMAWLQLGSNPLNAEEPSNIFTALGVKPSLDPGNRRSATLDANFTLETSLLIRQKAKTDAKDKSKPDFVYLHDQGNKPILSGTSVGGALRSRALKIAKTIRPDQPEEAKALIEGLFGSEPNDSPNAKLHASRLSIKETCIEGGIHDQVQARVSIDRFTGGALDTALFSEQPLFGSNPGAVNIHLHLRDPQDHELGLLILLLKDLWTGDLPLGGEASIGRGRLRGFSATLETPIGTWVFKADGDRVHVEGVRSRLQPLVDRLHTEPWGQK